MSAKDAIWASCKEPPRAPTGVQPQPGKRTRRQNFSTHGHVSWPRPPPPPFPDALHSRAATGCHARIPPHFAASTTSPCPTTATTSLRPPPFHLAGALRLAAAHAAADVWA
eukprot:357077-Chlamydomonas_euryale.AAC.2